MPRVAGIYARPTGIDAVANNTIDSGKYNSNVADVEADLNLPRPIVAGGTGATNATQARSNLQAEVALQIVTNFDIQVWEAGSFVAPAAIGGPVDGHAFYGTYFGDPTNSVLISYDITDVNRTNYVRHRVSGIWQPWTPIFTMSQDLIIANDTPTLELRKPTSSTSNIIRGSTAGNARWEFILGDSTAETGGNAGSDAGLYRFSDAGSLLSPSAFSVTRLSGNTRFNGRIGVGADPDTTVGWTNTTVGMTVRTNGHTSISGAAGHIMNVNINADGTMILFNRSGNPVGSISVTTTATAYNTSSDERLKEDLQPAAAGAQQIINDTNVYNFRWKSSGERAYGVIAQQANEVYPTAILHDTATDTWGVDYSKYVPLLLQEAKTLQKRIADLETKLTAAMSRLDVLDKFREKIEAL